MGAYLLRRLALAAVNTLAIATLVFLFLHTAYHEANAVLGPRHTNAQLHDFVVANGLDKPLPVQYGYFLANLFGHGRLAAAHSVPTRVMADGVAEGYSQGVSLSSLVSPPLVNSLLLAATGYAIALPVATGLGLYLGTGRRRALARTAETVFAAAYAVPVFLASILLIDGAFRAFGYVFNPVGWQSGNPFADPVGLVIGALALALGNVAVYGRYLRAAVADNVLADYARTARGSGASERRVILRHVLRNAACGPVAISPAQFATLAGMQGVLEYQLGYPGLGGLFISAVHDLDYYTILGGLLLVSVLVVVFSLAADVVLAALDPRVRLR